MGLACPSLGVCARPHAVADRHTASRARCRRGIAPLTFHGRPMSELLHGRGAGIPWALPTLRQQADGQISGVVVDATGQPLADQRVELRRPSSDGCDGSLRCCAPARGPSGHLARRFPAIDSGRTTPR